MEADPIELFTRMGEVGGGMRVEVIELATTLKARGFQTAIVTNNAGVPGELDEVGADRRHLSRDRRLSEIDPEARSANLRTCPRDPRHRPVPGIFVDDFEANVEAAEALGFRGVLMKDDYHPALEEIGRLTR